jgi:hypothetical protein
MTARKITRDLIAMAASPMPRWGGFAILGGLALGVLGPFGSYMNGGLVGRCGYWVATMLIAVVLYGVALKGAAWIAPPGSVARWFALVGAALIASVPEALATRTIAFWLWPALARRGPDWPVWFAQTAVIGLAATLGVALVRMSRSPSGLDRAVPVAIVRPGMELLSGDVLALQMEDHYVRVHTALGSELILMPLGQAIERVQAEGLRTHRSWWIARHAVVAIDGSPRAMRLHLSNGVVAPVARSAVIHLKAAGWLAP